MSDTPEGWTRATYTGAAPRYFPGLRLMVSPGDECEIPDTIAAEMADVFAIIKTKATKANQDTKEGEG